MQLTLIQFALALRKETLVVQLALDFKVHILYFKFPNILQNVSWSLFTDFK